MLEKILRKIEKMREYPEPIRRQLLWVFVASFSLFIGVVWAATLGWQMRDTQTNSASTEANKDNKKTTLPGIRDAVLNDIRSVKGASKNALREFLLKDNSSKSQNDTQNEAQKPEDNSSPTDEPVKLPQ